MFSPQSEPFIHEVRIFREEGSLQHRYAEEISSLRNLEELKLHPKVTFFIGENGSGKSTLLEAIAVAAGFNPEGGNQNFNFESKATHADLYKWIRLRRGMRGTKGHNGYFMRAESFYNLATEIEKLGLHLEGCPYGGRRYHEQSHGEAFLSFFADRLFGHGLYILDEPEAALSPQRQLAFCTAMHRLVLQGAQLIIATHSPIIMAYPDCTIYQFDASGVNEVKYRDTEHYRVTQLFMSRPEKMMQELMKEE